MPDEPPSIEIYNPPNVALQLAQGMALAAVVVSMVALVAAIALAGWL